MITLLARDILSGDVRDRVDFQSFRFDRSLSRTGSWTATIPFYGRGTSANLDPMRTYITAVKDDVHLYSGVQVGFNTQGANGVVLAGSDPFYLAQRRVLDYTRRFAQVDQFTIVEQLMSEVPELTVSYPALSGVLRDRTYYGFELRKIADMVSALAGVQRGFDFSVDFTGTEDAGFSQQLTLGYPTLGRSTDIVFDDRSNCEITSWAKDGSRMVNRAWASGAGQNNGALRASHTNAASLLTTPLLEDVFPYKTVTRQDTLNLHAETEVARRVDQVETVTLRVTDLTKIKVGSFIPGDRVRVKSTAGFNNINGAYRVMSYSVSVSDTGEEDMAINLATTASTEI